ncbi:MAG: recombinase family protein [Sarcina sp.]
MENICIYLRKSRADEELEKTLGEGETLSKHRQALLRFAKSNNLNINEIKEEIVSGENIIFRPKMIELLQEVEEKKYSGVLVMDIQRLGRGDMQDQGMILKTFKNSNTKILTPQKTYDLNNDFDEEYTEFEAFMSRKELKMINRRMQGGRVRSVEEGNYIATNPPLGYDITHIKKARSLKINAPEAKIIKLIFSLYNQGNGAASIAQELNKLGYKTKAGNKFISSSILNIIKNPIYIGKITWKKKEIKKSLNPDKVKDTRTRDKSEWIISEGKHKGIIEESDFKVANEMLSNKYHIPYQLTNKPVNPYAGVLKCGVCGKAMVMRNLRGIQRVMCTHKCGNRSSRYDVTEDHILKTLELYVQELRFKSLHENDSDNTRLEMYLTQINALEKELITLNDQKLKLFDLLERGIYDDETFIERSNNLAKRIDKIADDINHNNAMLKKEKSSICSKQDIDNFESTVAAFINSDDVAFKNQCIKKIVTKIEYTKIASTANKPTINLFAKINR